MQLTINDLPTGYRQVLNTVINSGCLVSPRGDATRELLGVKIFVENTDHVLPVGIGRGIRTDIADTEALELIAGEHDPENQRFNPASGFKNDPNLLCYGALTRDGIERSVDWLAGDPGTRRAAANLGHVGRDSAYPCLASLGWMIRCGRLHSFSDFRSQDAWLGLPYDLHAVAALGRTMANVLGVEPGPVHHYCRSLHMYTRHFDLVRKVTDRPEALRPTMELTGASWDAVQFEARRGLEAMRAARPTEAGSAPEDLRGA